MLRLGLMGKTTPPKGFSSRLRIRMLPTLPGLALAPKTATECGRNSGSSEECSTFIRCPSSVRLRRDRHARSLPTCLYWTRFQPDDGTDPQQSRDEHGHRPFAAPVP